MPVVKSIDGVPLIPGRVILVNKEYWEYAGDYDTVKEAPNKRCCFTVGGFLYVKRHNDKTEKPKEKRNRSDDERSIDTTIKDGDNTLMILVKQVIKEKGVTRGDFRKIYTNTSDMNNMLRCIEQGESLSWSRFTDIIEKLNLKYNLDVYEESKEKKK